MAALGLLIIGSFALLAGAELMTRRGTQLAARLGVSPILIGFTVVAIGTSTPELAVAVQAARSGSGGLVLGTIAGTNTVNILLILGLSTLLVPLAIEARTVWVDLPMMVLSALIFLALAWDGGLSRFEGLFMLGTAAAYTVGIVALARRQYSALSDEFTAEYGWTGDGRARLLVNLLALVVSIVVLVVGAGWFVDGAVRLATLLEVPETVIGLTVVAVGTSSPELVTTIVGTLRNNRDIAIGNLLGSSVYNILVILGLACVVPSAGILLDDHAIRIDILVMTGAALACIPVFVTGRRVTRTEGGLFIAAYAVYLSYLLLTRT